ncbi:Slco6d1 protein [Apodemus speciosus]|uniref:Slco6d1 protein n=1 Tax=Apodemus speciosus TaxID=105296 RepID=A0ABQ0EE03_APOSI
MAQDKRKTKDEVKQDTVVESDEHQKNVESRKIETYLITLPTAVKKLADIPDKKSTDPKYSDSSEGPFGLGPLVFPALQRFNNIKFFLFMCCLATLPHAHFGGRGNRARWVAAATIVTGLAAIVFAVPYFYYEIIKMETLMEEDLCYDGKKPKICEAAGIPHKLICIYLFILGQFLHGIAGMPLYLLAITFIFDHVPTFSTGLYLAIADASLTFGYILGFLIGLKCFQFPVKEAMKAVKRGSPEPADVEKFRILQSGWWKTYIIVASISLCSTLPLLCFPSNLPGAHKIRLAKSQEHPCIDRRLINKKIKPNLKSVLHAIWRIFIFPAYIAGRFIGGYVVDKLRMNIKNKLKFIMAVSAISILFFLLLITVECETAKFPGINDDYDGHGIIGNLKAPCNENCGCTSTVYTAICGRDEKQYFSPCFAGCSASKRLRTEKAYYNCSCIKEGLTSPDDEGQYIDALSGTCNTNCLTLPLFFAFYFSAAIYSNLCSIPSTLITLE